MCKCQKCITQVDKFKASYNAALQTSDDKRVNSIKIENKNKHFIPAQPVLFYEVRDPKDEVSHTQSEELKLSSIDALQTVPILFNDQSFDSLIEKCTILEPASPAIYFKINLI